MAKMTAATVTQAKPGKARREIPDSYCPGLYLVVQPSGAKSWAARYRFAGTPRKLTLGTFPVVDLVAARELAGNALRAVAAGHDPATEKQEARRVADIEEQRTQAGLLLKASDSFESIWAAYVADAVETFRPKSQAEWKRLHKRHLSPQWGKLTLAEISPAHVDVLLHGMRATPDARDKSLSILVAFFNWCMTAPRRLLPVAPTFGIPKLKRRKEDEEERTRALSDDELRWVWLASQESGYPFGQIYKMLILTGARLREVANVPRSEIEGRLWRLPAARAKNGKAYTVHLSDAALDVLESVPTIGNKSDFVFTTNGETPCSGFTRAKDRLDRNMLRIAREERGDKFKIEPWRVHDLRRTFVSGLAKLNIPIAVAEKCVNHISGSHGGLRKVYDRHEYAEEMRAAFDAWGRYVTALVTGKAPANVVSLRQRVAEPA